MYKSFTRRLILGIVLGTLSGPIAHADSTPPVPGSVTGGDPVPISPHVVTILLTMLQSVL